MNDEPKKKILLTGGTGNLGRAVRKACLDAGHQVRVLSRRERPAELKPDEWATGNPRTGVGIDAAVEGRDVIIHCATDGRSDVVAAESLIKAQRLAQGTPHLIFVSIVGIDQIPMFYHRAKLRVARLIAGSGLPYSIIRATQFHSLINSLFAVQRRLPIMIVPAVSFQPIDVSDVATRLLELATGPALNRVPDIGGPEVRTAADLGAAHLAHHGQRKKIISVSLPGRLFAALKAGRNLVPEQACDRITFEEFLGPREKGLR